MVEGAEAVGVPQVPEVEIMVEAASEEATVEPVASSGFKGGHYSQFKKR
jgi:hypothetical protein